LSLSAKFETGRGSVRKVLQIGEAMGLLLELCYRSATPEGAMAQKKSTSEGLDWKALVSEEREFSGWWCRR
jgi:hypothetical protein